MSAASWLAAAGCAERAAALWEARGCPTQRQYAALLRHKAAEFRRRAEAAE